MLAHFKWRGRPIVTDNCSSTQSSTLQMRTYQRNGSCAAARTHTRWIRSDSSTAALPQRGRGRWLHNCSTAVVPTSVPNANACQQRPLADTAHPVPRNIEVTGNKIVGKRAHRGPDSDKRQPMALQKMAIKKQNKSQSTVGHGVGGHMSKKSHDDMFLF